jgi:hypothetical protein
MLFTLFCLQAMQAQIIDISVETHYEDDGTIEGYPLNHKTFRIYATVTNATDRVNGITGEDENPLTLQVSGSGVWNHPAAGVTSDNLDCDIFNLFPAAEFDSYLTIGLSCNSDGSAYTIYTAEDPAYTWMNEMFNADGYGSVQNVNVNSAIGAGWFVVPSNPASLPDASNRVLLAQITTNGTVCGTFNAQVFPEYGGPGSPFLIQNGLSFGNPEDSDGDGYTGCDGDCNNNNSSIFPGAIELCNGIDDNCNGVTDEGLLTTFYRDLDGDGYGNPNFTINACTLPNGYVLNSLDCNDNNPNTNPDSIESCNYMDDDCNGTVDDGFTYNTYYIDYDGDGFGDPNEPILACEPNGDIVENNSDCNDNNPNINPTAAEICNYADDDCNGTIDDGFTYNTYYLDNDGDGFGNPNDSLQFCEPNVDYVDNNSDCNDNDPFVNPNTEEICNGIDDNCNGIIDEGFTTNTFYADIDGDGYGDPNNSITTCDEPEEGFITDNTDCNDSNPDINPGTAEQCNGIDDNCNFNTDEGIETSTYYFDNDMDGFGDPESTYVGCSQPSGYVENSGDCNDNSSNISPLSDESCNGTDDNCDGNIDENLPLTAYYLDADDDGYGDLMEMIESCGPVNGYVLNSLDCDDSNASVYPGAPEQCNENDDNCNGSVDENIVDLEYFADADGDGIGAASLGLFCLAPPNSSLIGGDCDDQNPDINPEATEICNGVDDNCNEGIDELVGTVYYEDLDSDGYGNAEVTVIACDQPVGFTDIDGDCDDNNSSVNPGATELCNDNDDNCNGASDEGLELLTYYADTDMDGYGDDSNALTSCVPLQGYVLNNEDCNDNNNNIYPGNIEFCNETDDNCDGETDEDVVFQEYYADNDGDDFGDELLGSFCVAPENASLAGGDCNDSNPDINPNASEFCNNTDDNCNGSIDEDLAGNTYYLDADGDGVGAEILGEFCQAPLNSSTIDGDCDDTNAAINPQATESCNQIDDNCDGAIDEFLGTLYYADIDSDGFGNVNAPLIACDQPTGYSTNGEDCDDSNAAVNPDAEEIPGNDIDENCDGQIISVVQEIRNLSIELYPNPVVDELLISTTGLSGYTEIIIFDVLGNAISRFTAIAGNQPIRINSAGLSQGNYYVTLENSKGNITGRFIKL